MNISMLRTKIHRATVTGADLNYEGSVSICPDLIKASGLLINERVDIYNCNNGARFSTYVIKGKKRRDLPEWGGCPSRAKRRSGDYLFILRPELGRRQKT